MDEFEFFLEKEWSDGLPVVTPTEDRIALMLSGTRREPGEVIGYVAPAGGELSIQTIATHAVMAGCKPEYMPVLIAGLEALLDERFNVNLIQATTSAGAPFLLVNGPYAKKIGLHGGVGCMGPGFRGKFDYWPRSQAHHDECGRRNSRSHLPRWIWRSLAKHFLHHGERGGIALGVVCRVQRVFKKR